MVRGNNKRNFTLIWAIIANLQRRGAEGREEGRGTTTTSKNRPSAALKGRQPPPPRFYRFRISISHISAAAAVSNRTDAIFAFPPIQPRPRRRLRGGGGGGAPPKATQQILSSVEKMRRREARSRYSKAYIRSGDRNTEIRGRLYI